MKRLRKLSPIQSRRAGTTLTEVLMSLLCMGIGVVAVASLFPIALLRSVQATQLTEATVLRFNAETLIDLYNEPPTSILPKKNLIFNPDFHPGDPSATPAPIPPNNNYAEHFINSSTTAFNDTIYLIDPYGAMLRRDEKAIPLDQNTVTGLAQIDLIGNIRRYDAMRMFYATPAYGNAITAANQAAEIVTLPDSWVTLQDAIAQENDDKSVTLAEDVNQDVIDAISGGQTVRAVLFNEDTRRSETRRLKDVGTISGTRVIDWTFAQTMPTVVTAEPLLPNNGQFYTDPTDPTTGLVSRVRLEVRDRRYSWLLSVRNTSSNLANLSALVEVVVFFNRTASEDEETTFTLSPIAGQPLQYQVNPIAPNTNDPKFLKKGSFMLDTNTGKWHRIQKFTGSPPIVTFEKNTGGNLDTHEVVFMRGVVEVFSLKPKS